MKVKQVEMPEHCAYLGHFQNAATMAAGHNTIHLNKAGEHKVEKVMREFKRGTLHSGSQHGPKVRTHQQAMAIAMSEAKKAMRGV